MAALGYVEKLIEKISGKKFVCPKEAAALERRAQALLYANGPSQTELTPACVRVVVFRDDKGVKQPLFDSQVQCDQGDKEQDPPSTRSLCDLRSGEKLERSANSLNGFAGVCSSAGWKTRRGVLARRPSSDAELLGEMMFGSMPMKTVGNSVKVHYIRSTDQLMLTKVFSVQRKAMPCCSLTDFSESCPLPGELSSQVIERSMAPIPKNHSFRFNITRSISPQEIQKSRSHSLNVPQRPCSSLSLSTCSPSPSPPSLSYTSVDSSLTRRIQRSRSTSLENASELYRKVLKPLDQTPRKGRKYAIGVIVCLSELKEKDIEHFQEFVFAHFSIINAHIERLKEGAEEGLLNRTFQATFTKAYQTFLSDFLSLYAAPRIQNPVWLSLISLESQRQPICLQFMAELSSAIVEFDNKDTKFFLSSLLTAVLSHHLAWAYTVSRSTDDRQNKMAPKSLAVLAESHPYNPLWAQLVDLFGAVSNPLKITRTIVTGSQRSVVMRLLYILTYFIRCSEVQPSPLSTERAPHAGAEPTGTGEPDAESSLASAVGEGASQSAVRDWDKELEDDVDVFGPTESRASSVTVMSEHDRHPLASPGPVDLETPVVRPHPFSFKTQGHTSNSFSSTDSRLHSDSDSFDAHAHIKVSSSFDGTGSSGTVVASLHSNSRRKSNSFTKSGSVDLSSSQSSHLSTSLTKSLGSKSAEFSRQTVAVPTSSSQTDISAMHPTHPVDLPLTSPLRFPTALRTCVGPSCPDFPEEGQTTTANSTDVTPSHINCHYRDLKLSCAPIASYESMGQCSVASFVRFDPGRTYSHRGTQPDSTPPRNESCESLSDLSTHAVLSRNTSSGSLSHPAFPSLPHAHPSDSQSGFGGGSTTMARQLCSSVDSGYDQSLTASSLTDSARESNTDSLLISASRTGLSLDRAGLLESNALVDLYLQPSSEEGLTIGLQQRLAGAKRSPTPEAGVTAGRSSGTKRSLTPELPPQQTASDASISLGEAGCMAPPTSLTPPPDHQAEETITPCGRQRSGAFSVSHRRSLSSEDCPGVQPPGRHSNIIPNAPRRTKLSSALNTRSEQHLRGNSPTIQISCIEESQSDGCASRSDRLASRTSSPSPSPSPPPTLTASHLQHQRLHSSRHNSPEPPCLGSVTSPTTANTQNTRSSLLYVPSCHSPVPIPASGPDGERGYNTSGCHTAQSWRESDEENDMENEEEEEEERVREGGFASIDVLESLSPATMSILHNQRSQLEESLRLSEHIRRAGLPTTIQHLGDFTEVDLPSLDDFNLDSPDEFTKMAPINEQSSQLYQNDFGHSLLVGHSPTYLPDFVLHGTSDPFDHFKEKLVSDLATVVQHSIIDEPTEHGLAIVADTDSWTCKLVLVSRSYQSSDVVVATNTAPPSQFAKQLLSSVRGMAEMRMPAEFCLSHIEDRLLELNEKGIALASSVLEHGADSNLSQILPLALRGINAHPTDMPTLISLASVHCPDPDIKAALNYALVQQLMARPGLA